MEQHWLIFGNPQNHHAIEACVETVLSNEKKEPICNVIVNGRWCVVRGLEAAKQKAVEEVLKAVYEMELTVASFRKWLEER